MNGVTPLHLAAARGEKVLIKRLLQHGAKRDIGNRLNNKTAIMVAADCGQAGSVRVLLKEGASPLEPRAKGKATPLHFAAHGGNVEVMRLMLDKLPEFGYKEGEEIVDSNGLTPLMIAAVEGHADIVAELADRKFGSLDYKIPDLETTAIIGAAYHGKLDVIKVLLAKGADLSDSISIAVDAARKKNHQDVLEYLISQRKMSKKKTKPTLHYAVANSTGPATRGLLKTLISQGAPVNEVDSNGAMPLHTAASRGEEIMVKTLLAHKAARDGLHSVNGRTPIWLAASAGHANVVKILLENGASPLLPRDKENVSPVQAAVNNGHVAVIKMMLEKTKGSDREKAIEEARDAARSNKKTEVTDFLGTVAAS
ncbi:hypothetical protein HDU76_010623 [Blyttiomyces sp. JEL0837]|nr:hypothetical protein HDU76_010623 [Blyttiomyces sp. JEL0837]